MQNMQIPWPEVARQLTEAVRASTTPLPDLAAQAEVNYYALYRISRDGIKNRGKNTLALCKFFGIALERAPAVSAEELAAAVVDSWDGSPEHGRLLIELVRCTEHFRVMQKTSDEQKGTLS